jgi:hypothetical protein
LASDADSHAEPFQVLPYLAQVQSNNICGTGDTVARPEASKLDCYDVLEEMTFARRPGEDGPDGRPVDWIAQPRMWTYPVGRVLPMLKRQGQCKLQLDFQDEIMALYPARASLHQVREVFRSLISECVVQGRAKRGDRHIWGMTFKVSINPNKSPGTLRGRWRQWWGKFKGGCCSQPSTSDSDE